jgi:hypothetical protein
MKVTIRTNVWFDYQLFFGEVIVVVESMKKKKSKHNQRLRCTKHKICKTTKHLSKVTCQTKYSKNLHFNI